MQIHGLTVAQQTLLKFDRFLHDSALHLGDDSPLKYEADLIREAYHDLATLSDEEGQPKWGHRSAEFLLARISLERFMAASTALAGTPGATKLLKDVIAGSITQDFERSSAKDKLYELELAAPLKRAGFVVELREPDIVASGNGLSKPLAIACKYPSSRQQIHEHISKGYRQISKQNLDGVVAIGFDLIIGTEQGLHGILDFGRGSLPPEEILDRHLVKEIVTLERERREDYPSERPLDGLIITAAIAAKDNDSASLTFSNVLRLCCLPGNPLKADLEIVKQKIDAISP